MSSVDHELEKLMGEMAIFILSALKDDNYTLLDWIKKIDNKLPGFCWKKKKCHKTECPAYKNDCGRCWLIAGTMCDNKTTGTFALKYDSCMNCEVYIDTVCGDSVTNLREMIIILIHSLMSKKEALKGAMSDIQALRGLIPICASCKNIRDDKGYWKQLEEYVYQHSEAQFTHSVCPKCLAKLYPELSKDK